MISNPKDGWCNFHIGDFYGTPSYTTNVPLDLMQAFIDYGNFGEGVAWFNEKGSSFTLVLSQDGVFVIHITKEAKTEFYEATEPVDALKKELVRDIKGHFDDWAKFDFDACFLEGQNGINARNTNRYMLRNKLEELKR